jgi:N-methylhydantoinase B/oxoprolinase/acetone carboxylase alpha subunit
VGQMDRTEHRQVHEQAMVTAQTNPELLEPRHVSRAEARQMVHGSGAAGRFNNRLAVVITRLVGTMWCAYVVVARALVSFPQAFAGLQRGDTLVAVTWHSQSFLQLVLLPIIIVGQNVSAAAQDGRAEADHETLTALKQISVRELRILEQQQQILVLLRDRGLDPRES